MMQKALPGLHNISIDQLRDVTHITPLLIRQRAKTFQVSVTYSNSAVSLTRPDSVVDVHVLHCTWTVVQLSIFLSNETFLPQPCCRVDQAETFVTLVVAKTAPQAVHRAVIAGL